MAIATRTVFGVEMQIVSNRPIKGYREAGRMYVSIKFKDEWHRVVYFIKYQDDLFCMRVANSSSTLHAKEPLQVVRGVVAIPIKLVRIGFFEKNGHVHILLTEPSPVIA